MGTGAGEGVSREVSVGGYGRATAQERPSNPKCLARYPSTKKQEGGQERRGLFSAFSEWPVPAQAGCFREKGGEDTAPSFA